MSVQTLRRHYNDSIRTNPPIFALCSVGWLVVWVLMEQKPLRDILHQNKRIKNMYFFGKGLFLRWYRLHCLKIRTHQQCASRFAHLACFPSALNMFVYYIILVSLQCSNNEFSHRFSHKCFRAQQLCDI